MAREDYKGPLKRQVEEYVRSVAEQTGEKPGLAQVWIKFGLAGDIWPRERTGFIDALLALDYDLNQVYDLMNASPVGTPEPPKVDMPPPSEPYKQAVSDAIALMEEKGTNLGEDILGETLFERSDDPEYHAGVWDAVGIITTISPGERMSAMEGLFEERLQPPPQRELIEAPENYFDITHDPIYNEDQMVRGFATAAFGGGSDWQNVTWGQMQSFLEDFGYTARSTTEEFWNEKIQPMGWTHLVGGYDGIPGEIELVEGRWGDVGDYARRSPQQMLLHEMGHHVYERLSPEAKAEWSEWVSSQEYDDPTRYSDMGLSGPSEIFSEYYADRALDIKTVPEEAMSKIEELTGAPKNWLDYHEKLVRDEAGSKPMADDEVRKQAVRNMVAEGSPAVIQQTAIFNQPAENWSSTNELGYNVLDLQKIQRRF